MSTRLDPPEHITIQEAADYLRETDRSVRRRIASGQLTGYRIGTKRIIVKRSDVEGLLVPITAAVGVA